MFLFNGDEEHAVRVELHQAEPGAKTGIDHVAFRVDDPVAAMTMAIQAQASEVGQKMGAKFGESFRYSRFHAIVEALLAAREG